MNFVLFFTSYVQWHYGRALRGIFMLWLNTLLFVVHYFSLLLLFKTLLAPWKRLQETYKGGIGLENILGLIIVNTVMRAVGAVIRLVVIAVGLAVLVLVVVGFIPFVFLWILAPAAVVVLFLNGFALLF